MRAFEENSRTIGNTPLVSLARVARGQRAKLFGKVEGQNPSYSVKCRIDAANFAKCLLIPKSFPAQIRRRFTVINEQQNVVWFALRAPQEGALVLGRRRIW